MQGGADQARGRASGPVWFNWHVGTLQPYSSLWLLVHRLSLINQITVADVRAIAARSDFSTGMYSLTQNIKTLDLKLFAAAIGERPQALNYSTLQPYPTWLHSQFLTTSIQYCPTCLRLGFHSPLQCLTLMKICPIHGEPLRRHCVCGVPISACVHPSMYRNAGTCNKCDRRFLDLHQARRPSMPVESLAAFDEVRDWLLYLGQNVTSMASDEARNQRSNVRLEATLALATRALGIPYPRCLAPEAMPMHAETTRCYQSPRTDRGVKGVASAGHPTYLVFCSIDRYLRRHVLRGQLWITRLAMYGDADYIAKTITSEPDALLAWTYLLWLMAVFQSKSLRDLRSRTAYHAYGGRINLPGTHSYYSEIKDPQIHHWLQYHAAETSLLALWRDLHQAVLGMAQSRDVHWGPRIADVAARFHWVGLCRSDGSAEYAVVQTIGVKFGYAALPPRPHRRTPPPAQPRKSEVALSTMCRHKKGLCKGPDGEWKAGLLTTPSKEDRPRLKVHTLLHVGAKLHFIVMRKANRPVAFAARLVEFGLEGRGADARAAVESLRLAVRQYTKTYGSPWRSDRPRVVTQDRSLEHSSCTRSERTPDDSQTS